MKKIALCLLGLLGMYTVQAQEVLISDADSLAAFEGIIGYHIKYEGKVDPKMRPYLPDSVTLFVGQNGMRYVYNGGQIAGLQSELLWDGATQSVWLLDSQRKTAAHQWEYWKGNPGKLAKLQEPAQVAGHKCRAVSITVDKQVEKLWVNDSIFFGGMLVDSLKAQQPNFLAAGMRAIPLKTKRGQPNDVVTVMTAVTIRPQVLDALIFSKPDDYKVIEFDPAKPWHAIIGHD